MVFFKENGIFGLYFSFIAIYAACYYTITPIFAMVCMPKIIFMLLVKKEVAHDNSIKILKYIYISLYSLMLSSLLKKNKMAGFQKPNSSFFLLLFRGLYL